MNVKSIFIAGAGNTAGRSAWLFSWPLIVGSLVYLLVFFHWEKLLRDGDTYWHIAAGQWILEHGAVPAKDPFSHTMRGAAWTAHEWLSEVVLALAHAAGGWSAVVALTALAFAVTVALLVRALLQILEPIYALMLAALAVLMTTAHLLARPHILAMPLLLVWTVGLVRASESGRAPSLWLLPVMTLWANMHGGFTLGIALAFAFAFEALLAARREQRAMHAVRSWGGFLMLAVISALLTPHGLGGILFTWEIFTESSYALTRIGEWRSPNFHRFQALELWLLAGLAMVMHQGLRLPPVRLALLLGLIHLALKHARNVELLGLLTPLLFATPFAAQWAAASKARRQQDRVDHMFRRLAGPAGHAALAVGLGLLLGWTLWISRTRPPKPPETAAPILAIQAGRNAAIQGPVLNEYHWGGYLIYMGVPPFIDGRADMYKDAFLKEYLDALGLTTRDGLQDLLEKHRIQWTLLKPGSPPVTLLDHLPDWRRLYADENAVVHVRTQVSTGGEKHPSDRRQSGLDRQ
ncbi:hypothetical protein [Ramlibacter sp. 2FC]|uniref:hypothetical protein n=1 Tax=Ramlibacter sp. 2FC TaxID=2502188 RepID=UPI0010F7D8B4|nr:hypothetical protein [Ramlibacter sp. 2FC]